MNNTSAYLVAVPELKSPTRVVPVIVTALVHVVVIAGLVKGLTVISASQSPPDITVVTVPETINITEPENLPLTKPMMPSLTFDPPKDVVIKVASDPLVGPTESDDRTRTGGTTIEVPTPASSLVAPKLLHKYEPPYPPASRRMGEQGVVKLMLSVAPNGQVIRAEVLQSSGYSRLDQAAVDAVQSWRYSPAQRDGVSVSESIPVLVRFSLT